MIDKLLGGSTVVLSLAVFAGTLAIARPQAPARQTEAVRSFSYAISAERQHATLFRKALESLDRTPTHPG